jgi:hypothetical protein
MYHELPLLPFMENNLFIKKNKLLPFMENNLFIKKNKPCNDPCEIILNKLNKFDNNYKKETINNNNFEKIDLTRFFKSYNATIDTFNRTLIIIDDEMKKISELTGIEYPNIYSDKYHLKHFTINDTIVYLVPSVKKLINKMIENTNLIYKKLYKTCNIVNKMFRHLKLDYVNIEMLNEIIKPIF